VLFGIRAVRGDRVAQRVTRNYYMPAVIFILLVAAFNLFYHLGVSAVSDWDESRHGITAYDMVRNGDLVKTTYLGGPDYYNLKPPLGIWLIALSYKMFGVNLFALRVPSATSALLSVFLIMVWARKYFNENVSALSGAILATSTPFIRFHSGRTGDLDSQISLLILISLFLYYIAIRHDKHRFFYLSGFVISLVFLIKSFTFILPLSIMCSHLLITGKYRTLKGTDYLLFLGCVLMPILTWVIARYSQDGFRFLSAMVSYDLLKRSTSALEGHTGGPLFHLAYLWKNYSPWVLILLIVPFQIKQYLPSLNPGESKRKTAGNNLYGEPLYFLWILIPLLIATLLKTKIPWYINPVYPPLAIALAWHINKIINGQEKKVLRNFLITILIVLPFCIAEYRIAKHVTRGNRSEIQKVLFSMEDKSIAEGTEIYSLSPWKPAETMITYAMNNPAAETAGYLSI